jgi:hypothetical protein
MEIKVFGANGASRIMTAKNYGDIYKISKCYSGWEYIR